MPHEEHSDEFKPFAETKELAETETLKRHEKWLTHRDEYKRVNEHSKIPGIHF